jgi:hypothetical protein
VCGGVGGVGVDVEEVDDGMGGRDGMGMAWGVAVGVYVHNPVLPYSNSNSQYIQYSQYSASIVPIQFAVLVWRQGKFLCQRPVL